MSTQCAAAGEIAELFGADYLDSLVAPPRKRKITRRVTLFAAAAAAVAATTRMVTPVMADSRPLRVPSAGGFTDASDLENWRTFKRRFLQADGRVIDTSNLGVSHSEGQGVGMLLAVACADRVAFESIWGWTRSTLRRDADALHTWRYKPYRADPLDDPNNATDGDLYIAGALLRAYLRWGDETHLAAAFATAESIRTLLTLETSGRLVLLPSRDGFVGRAGTVVNLSYYIWPLLDEIATAWPSPTWDRLRSDGRALLADARFGRWKLTPDWLLIDDAGHVRPAPGRAAQFSFDAIRVPLFLAWGRAGDDAMAPFRAFWSSRQGQAPAWVDLDTNACSPASSQGGGAIASLALGRNTLFGKEFADISSEDDYYSASLILLSRLARVETRPTGTRVPASSGSAIVATSHPDARVRGRAVAG